MFPGQAPSGQWARTRNTESAKAFLAEQEQQRELAEARRGVAGKLRARVGLVVFVAAMVILAVLGVLGSLGW